jgi:hypothetical protein
MLVLVPVERTNIANAFLSTDHVQRHTSTRGGYFFQKMDVKRFDENAFQVVEKKPEHSSFILALLN